MENNVETIHIQPVKHSANMHVVLLFIPALVFVIMLALLARQTSKQYAYTQESQVLGDETPQSP